MTNGTIPMGAVFVRKGIYDAFTAAYRPRRRRIPVHLRVGGVAGCSGNISSTILPPT